MHNIDPNKKGKTGLYPHVVSYEATPDRRVEVPRFRLARRDELNFVRSSWFESYRKGGCAPEVAFPTYKTGQNAVMDLVLSRAPVWVATLPEVPDEVLGWVCYDDQAVHYLYVKQPYRRRRIATALLSLAKAAGAQELTHPTRAGKALARGLTFNPFFLAVQR